MVVIPLLTLALGVDIRYAVGAALVSSIANSSGAASAYIREGITNVRIGMFLEIGTTTGAVLGALIAVYTPTTVVAVLFGIMLIFSAVMSLWLRPCGSMDLIPHPRERCSTKFAT